jgi:hypothetical protein
MIGSGECKYCPFPPKTKVLKQLVEEEIVALRMETGWGKKSPDKHWLIYCLS